MGSTAALLRVLVSAWELHVIFVDYARTLAKKETKSLATDWNHNTSFIVVKFSNRCG